jgi:hypothetical protein
MRIPTLLVFAARRLLLVSGLLLTACRYEPIQPLPGDAAIPGAGPDAKIAVDTGTPFSDDAPSPAPDGGSDVQDVGPGIEVTPTCGNACSAEISDGCCPGGCTAANDTDCTPRCGNGALEAPEQCDPPGACPTTCPNRGCTRYRLEGAAQTCTAVCVETSQETACMPGDGCCPAGCTSNSDSDCLVVCGNGVKEPSETCDPLATCPTTCAAAGCQLRKLINGGTCAAQCVNDGMQTMCASGDGCCPAACNSTNDTDCPVRCGNGVVEPGETCEPVAECTRRQTACRSDQNTLRTGSGSATACTFQCKESPRPCGPGDGSCPAGCARDPDCLPRPTDCCHLDWCAQPFQPNQGKVICITNDNARCTDAERAAECASDANRVCGTGHARPIIYKPPIGAAGSG